MNARQKAKKYKKEIKTLKSDNNLMREIIADSPAMQELYDVYNKPVPVKRTTIQFQEIRVKRMIPAYMRDCDGIIEHSKQAVEKELFDEIKGYITCEVDTECMTPSITASVFIGRK